MPVGLECKRGHGTLEKQKTSTRRKWLWGIGIFLGLALLSRIFNPQEPSSGPAVDASPSAAASYTLAPTFPVSPPTQKAPAPPPTSGPPRLSEEQLQAWADQIEADARAHFGVSSWQDTCAASNPGWSCLVNDMTSKQEGSLTITLLVPPFDPKGSELGDSAARALFRLLQLQHRDMKAIEVVDMDGGPLATVTRTSALPLEK